MAALSVCPETIFVYLLVVIVRLVVNASAMDHLERLVSKMA